MSTTTEIKATAVDVLEWLADRFPHLHAAAEVERSWVWLADVNLSGEANKPIREELKAYGFRWAKNGHPLPSGATGTWAHNGGHRVPFKRNGKRGNGSGPDWAKIAAEAGLTVEQLRQAVG